MVKKKKEKPILKCSEAALCEALSDRLRDGPAGLIRMMRLDLKSKVGEKGAVSNLICYKRNNKDKPLVLNFCPWCGVDLLPYQKLNGNGEMRK
jgi:hypothetical protein